VSPPAFSLREAEDYLLGLELFGMRFGLERMHRLMDVLGMPQRRFASVHVVGTNGKSSTVRFLAAILRRHGLRVGAYTSPHLRSFRERVEVDERPLPPDRFAAAVGLAADAAQAVNRTSDEPVTQFEALTAAAFHELARARVDVAVVEAGLGGRYDATNVIPSRVQLLTGVGLEHTRWLGDTPAQIAEEKLAVVRDHATLVTAPYLDPEVEAVAERVARDRRAGRLSPALDPAVPRLRARGRFQQDNFALAQVAARAFLERPLDRAAVSSAAAETEVPGRLEVVGRRPLTVLDGAHNPPGARALSEALPEVLGEHRPRVGLVSILDDKDAAGMLDALAGALDALVMTRCSNPRALEAGALADLARGADGEAIEAVAEPLPALARARRLAGPDGAVVATGSIYLVGDLVRGADDAGPSSM
jgi:dihydrofolate synthase/folylpolyglutamate synthase